MVSTASKQIARSLALLPDEPSKTNYWLDKGFSDLGATIRGSFARDKDTMSKLSAKMSEENDSKFAKAFIVVFSLLGIMSVLLFGFAITTVLTFLHSLFILAIMTCVYILLGISKGLDWLYRRILHIAFACDYCKNIWSQPGYICPKCGAVHSRLQPNIHGIFHHECQCGQKLPATFFVSSKKEDGTKVRRSELAQRCPNPSCTHDGHNGDARPISISVVGSRSVGKTAYISALAHTLLIEKPKEAESYTTELIDGEKETLFKSLEANYASGTTDMTVEAADLDRPSAFSLSFYIRRKGMIPDRLVHIYDVAGETFLQNDEHEIQLQYTYAEGSILIIDPFSIPEVADELGEQLSTTDRANTASVYPDKVVSNFIAKVKHVTNLGLDDRIAMPLAIVINKIDQPGLEKYFGEESRIAYKQTNLGCPEADIDDALVREFLTSHGMGNLLNMVMGNFAVHRFFSASSIGHQRALGAFDPTGVEEAFSWIVNQADRGLAKTLGFEELARIPFAIDKSRVQRNVAAQRAAERAKTRSNAG